MAAIDLERGLEHSGRGWGKERPELMDNFDSEMQEWEDQLQDIQRKIEELYNEVQARRGGNNVAPGDQRNGGELECSLGHVGNGLFLPAHRSKNHPGAATAPHHYSNGCDYRPNGCSYPIGHHSGYGHHHTDGVSEIGDLLQDYLGQDKHMNRKNNGARHVHFSDTILVSQDAPVYQDETRRRAGNQRLAQDQYVGSFEETENRKNRVSHMKSSPNKENTGAKPPLGQKDAPTAQSHSSSQLPTTPAESPALDRKAFGPGVLGDRKCSSPSVLRKFGAMLQENEGKLLTESGVVTQQGAEPRCPTAGCQRRAAGAVAGTGRAPVCVPVVKSHADSDLMTAKMEPSQEWGLVSDCGRQNHKDLRGAYSTSKGSHPSLQQAHRRPQVAGSPRIRPRANSVADRDGGHARGERPRKPASHHVEPKTDHRVSGASFGAQKVPRGVVVSPPELAGRDEGLIELLDMLEIQHEYSSSPRTGPTAFRQDPQQVNPLQLSPKPERTFSRPARPANQRPPSRWASRTPPAKISAPSGPMYRPPSPMSRTPSPALKHRPTVSYSLQAETVIM